MDMVPQKDNKNLLAVGAMPIMGLDAGFIYLDVSPMFLVASLLILIGLGFTIATMISKGKTH